MDEWMFIVWAPYDCSKTLSLACLQRNEAQTEAEADIENGAEGISSKLAFSRDFL